MPTNVGIEREILATKWNIGGYSADVSHAAKELVGKKSVTISYKECRDLSCRILRLNMARSLKILA